MPRDFRLVRQVITDRLEAIAADVDRYCSEAHDARDTDEAQRFHEAWLNINRAGIVLSDRKRAGR